MTDPDYSQYTDDELRRELAEVLGWREPQYDPELGQYVDCPNWPASLDACWRDLRVMGFHVSLDQIADGRTEIAFEREDAELYTQPEGLFLDPNPARAWCIAFLKLMREKGGQGSE